MHIVLHGAGHNFRNFFLLFFVFFLFFSFWFYSCFFNVLFTYANRISVQFNCAARLKVCIGYSHRPFFLSLLQQSGGHMKQPANTLTPTPTAHTHTQTLGPHNLTHTHNRVSIRPIVDMHEADEEPSASRATSFPVRCMCVRECDDAHRIQNVCVCLC